MEAPFSELAKPFLRVSHVVSLLILSPWAP